MSWYGIWAASALAGAAFGWLIGPIPLDVFVQLLVALADSRSDD